MFVRVNCACDTCKLYTSLKILCCCRLLIFIQRISEPLLITTGLLLFNSFKETSELFCELFVWPEWPVLSNLCEAYFTPVQIRAEAITEIKDL